MSEEDISLAASSNTVLDIREQQVEVARGELERARIAGLAELEIRKKELALAKAGIGTGEGETKPGDEVQ